MRSNYCMKQIIILVFITTVVCMNKVNAQSLVFAFGHAEYISALGDLKDTHNKGAGIEGGLGLGANKTFVTATIGYAWIQAQDNAAGDKIGNLVYSSTKLGVRHYVFRKNIFLKGDLGLGKVKPENDHTTSHFTGVIGAGVKFSGFEVVADYTTVTTWGSWFSLKAGFTFGL